MGELLNRYTENRPLILVIEDLHWSDQATVQLLDYVARRGGATRLLWLASFRLTEDIAADHPLRAVRHELRLHGLAEEIVLDAFSEQEVGEYLAERAPALALDETFVRTLHGRTDGLPLFVADVVNDVMAHGSRSGSMAMPKSLTGIIERYIRQLTAEERALLEAASVCGVEFRLASVARVLERDAGSLAESCAELARRQRWLSSVDAEYAFRHALYREVLYQRMPPVIRVALHRKVGASLERERAEGRNVSAAELASHFELGHEPMPALRYYVEAAQWALLHFSPSQTMSLTQRAMALLPLAEKSEARIDLEMTLATLRGAAAIQVLGTASDETKRAFERAQSLLQHVPQHPLRGLCLHALGLALCLRGELEEANALAQRTEVLAAATGDRTALLCACLVHGLVQHLRGRPRSAREWLEKGVAAAEGLDETTSPAVFTADPHVIILGLLAIALLHLGFVDQGRARMREAHARARVGAGSDRLRAERERIVVLERVLDPGRTLADCQERVAARVVVEDREHVSAAAQARAG